MSVDFDNFAELMKVSIDEIIEYGEAYPSDVYIKISEENVVKLSHSEDRNQDTFLRYKKKGIKEVYVNRGAYELYFYAVSNELDIQFAEISLLTVDIVKNSNRSFELFKEAINKLGIADNTIKMAKEVNKNAIRMIKRIKSLNKFFKKFRDECSDEFMKSTVLSYLILGMVDTFQWRSDSIKEKLCLATLLRDINLNRKEIDELNKYKKTPEELSKKVLSHPIDVSNKLKIFPNDIANETLVIIEQHHEMPDGKGFPANLEYEKINLLSAIHITAEYFLDILIEYKFDPLLLETGLGANQREFDKGPFKKAAAALKKILHLENKE